MDPELTQEIQTYLPSVNAIQFSETEVFLVGFGGFLSFPSPKRAGTLPRTNESVNGLFAFLRSTCPSGAQASLHEHFLPLGTVPCAQVNVQAWGALYERPFVPSMKKCRFSTGQ